MNIFVDWILEDSANFKIVFDCHKNVIYWFRFVSSLFKSTTMILNLHVISMLQNLMSIKWPSRKENFAFQAKVRALQLIKTKQHLFQGSCFATLLVSKVFRFVHQQHNIPGTSRCELAQSSVIASYPCNTARKHNDPHTLNNMIHGSSTHWYESPQAYVSLT